MSLWDRYFAPGDLRRRHQAETAPPPAPPPPPQQGSIAQALKAAENTPRIDAAARQRRQDALLFGGIFFTCLSLFITRRSLLRKRLPLPKTFTPSNGPPPKTEGALDAVEALGLASLNVFSFAMVAAGGLMKAFDIADIEDLRDGVRRGVGFDVYGGESEADKELESWVADILSRKDGEGDLKTSIAEKLHELEEKQKKLKEEGKR